MENLTLWLNQFETPDERRVAYGFVKKQMAFCSAARCAFVEIAYRTTFASVLRRTAEELKIDPFHVAKVRPGLKFAVRSGNASSLA